MISTVWYHCVKNSSFSLCWGKNGLTRGRKVRSTCSAGYPSDHSSLIASLRLTSTFTFFCLIKSILSCQTVKVWPLKQVHSDCDGMFLSLNRTCYLTLSFIFWFCGKTAGRISPSEFSWWVSCLCLIDSWQIPQLTVKFKYDMPGIMQF